MREHNLKAEGSVTASAGDCQIVRCRITIFHCRLLVEALSEFMESKRKRIKTRQAQGQAQRRNDDLYNVLFGRPNRRDLKPGLCDTT